MGTKRVGLARMEALMENLKREIIMGAGTSLAGARKIVTTLTNATTLSLTLTEADYPSGTLFACDFSTNNKEAHVTLPALTKGLCYTFVAQTTSGHTASITKISAAAGAHLQGVIVCEDGTEDGIGTHLQFDHSKFFAGTRVDFICDGVKWNVRATALCDVGEVAIS